jgi:hypothetical protein
MEELNHHKTPLGEKFDSTDFPLEPQAWGNLEKLLAAQKPKATPFIWHNKTLFLMALIGLGFLFLYISQSRKNLEKSAEITDISVGNQINTLTNLPSQESNTPTIFSLKNTTHSDIYNESLGDKAGIVTRTSSPLYENSVTRTISPLYENSVTRTSSPLYENSVTRTNSPSYVAIPPQYKTDFGGFSTSFYKENASKKSDNSSEIMEAKKERMLENKSEDKRESTTLVFNENKVIENDKSTQDVENQVDINRSIIENAILPLDLSELNTVYSITSDVNNPQNLWAKNVIPVNELVKGPRFQLDIGIGSATYFAPRNINHFRMAFQYRLTPLFGLGVSSNYSMKLNDQSEKGSFFASDLEGLLYFINKRKVDFVVSAGYGFRQWQIPSYITELKNGKGKGFTLGLVTQYRFNEKWVVGLRLDIKEISKTVQDPAFVLTLGKRF